MSQGQVGSLFNVVGAKLTNRFQHLAVEKSPLHIPLLFGYDVIHGERTIFPVPLALASSFDPDMVEQVAHTAATEAAGDGVRWAFSPMVDIARDARWGRITEGAGEDTYLGSVMAGRVCAGLPGRRLEQARFDCRVRETFRRLRRAERGPRVQHGRYVGADSAPGLPAALSRGDRRGIGHGDERVQSAQRRAGHRRPVHADKNPAPGMGLRRVRGERLRRSEENLSRMAWPAPARWPRARQSHGRC